MPSWSSAFPGVSRDGVSEPGTAELQLGIRSVDLGYLIDSRFPRAIARVFLWVLGLEAVLLRSAGPGPLERIPRQTRRLSSDQFLCLLGNAVGLDDSVVAFAVRFQPSFSFASPEHFNFL